MIIDDINKASIILQNNGLVAIPTETVYGLAGNAYNELAIKKIYELKKRPYYNPLIVHIKTTSNLFDIATEIPPCALKLAENFWPGPLTMVLNKKTQISDLITAGKKTVAIRVPNHPVTLALLELVEFPLCAPSANPFGSISPTCASHVFDYFGNEVDAILDGGQCKKGIESTIIGFEHNQPILYRHGSIPAEEIEKVVGKLRHNTKNNSSPAAPGMLSRHYAPSTDTYLTNDVHEFLQNFEGKRIGLILFNQKIENNKIISQEVLSPNGNTKEAARNLYAAMHRLDQMKLDVIIAERLPEKGLGKTINDKLERATKKD